MKLLVGILPSGGEAWIHGVRVPHPEIIDQSNLDEAGERVGPVQLPTELIVRGPQVMHGYWKQPGETAQALRDVGRKIEDSDQHEQEQR